MNVADQLKKKSKFSGSWRPIIFDLANAADRKHVAKLLGREVRHVVDDFEEQERELFQVENPSRVYGPTFANEFEAHRAKLDLRKPALERGRWVFYPWLSTIVHVLEDVDFQLVRTARNRNLINKEEQEKFYNAVIGIGGLSVGNSVALAIVLQGGGRHIRLADHDRLALSNTNRIRAGVAALGLPKVEMTARQIYEINPYAKVEIFSDGLNAKNIARFFSGPPKLDIVIDEMDNFAVKFLMREQARKHRLAVVMAADNGDNGVVDVERYDLNPKTPFFHNQMGKVSYEGLSKLDKFGIGNMIAKLVGPENVTQRMKESLPEIGKTIVSWPQLGGAALLNGSAVAYCVRKILNGQPVESNRTIVSLDEKLTPGYNSPAQRKQRNKSAAAFKKILGL